MTAFQDDSYVTTVLEEFFFLRWFLMDLLLKVKTFNDIIYKNDFKPSLKDIFNRC